VVAHSLHLDPVREGSQSARSVTSTQSITRAANTRFQAAAVSHNQPCVAARPAPASHNVKGCNNPSLHAGVCALACWWTPFSGRSQGPVDLHARGERGWTRGWTLWAVSARVHDVLCMRQRAADAASNRLLSWAHGWSRSQCTNGDVASGTVPAW